MPFRLQAVYCFVTWAKSRIDDHEVFYRLLVKRMPKNTQIFGARELHRDGSPHYHAAFRFRTAVHWPDARKRFMLVAPDGKVDTTAIRIIVPDKREDGSHFLGRTQSYCVKDKDRCKPFGEWIEVRASGRKGLEMVICSTCGESEVGITCEGCLSANWIVKVSYLRGTGEEVAYMESVIGARISAKVCAL